MTPRNRGTINQAEAAAATARALDAWQVKLQREGRVVNRVISPVRGVKLTGRQAVLGRWAAESEGARFWLSVVMALKNRGVREILLACGAGLEGLPEAREAVLPHTPVQGCFLPLVRHPLASGR